VRQAPGCLRVLDRTVHRIWLFGGLMLAAVVALVLLFKLLPSELAPAEDRGSFSMVMEGPEGAGYDYTVKQMQQVAAILAGELGFGWHFTDHMVAIQWDKAKGWHDAQVRAYGPLALDPAASVLHYGQEIFEGIKAYRHADGSIWTFRPDANGARLQRSAARLTLPQLPVAEFTESLRQLIAVDHAWVPSAAASSLDFRPFMIATEAFLGMRAAQAASYYVIASPAGTHAVLRDADGGFVIDMGMPDFTPAAVPLHGWDVAQDEYLRDVDGVAVRFGAVSMGNPHAVIDVADVATAPVAELGPALQANAAFPQSVNVGFAEVISHDHLRLRVYERGAGETRACGSGACAAVAVLTRRGRIDRDREIAVELPGGTLRIRYDQADGHIRMGGPVAFVFEGNYS